MNYANILQALVLTLADNAWLLSGLLIALLILKRVKDDVRPIFLSMVNPLAKQAQSNAVAWVIGIMLGTLASLGALTEVATQMHWLAVANMCKVLAPFLATIVALIKQSPVQPPAPPTGNTTPPFQVAKPDDSTKPTP